MKAAEKPAKTSNERLIDALDKALERTEKHKDKILSAKATLMSNSDVSIVELIEALAETGILQGTPFGGIHINGLKKEDVDADADKS